MQNQKYSDNLEDKSERDQKAKFYKNYNAMPTPTIEEMRFMIEQLRLSDQIIECQDALIKQLESQISSLKTMIALQQEIKL